MTGDHAPIHVAQLGHDEPLFRALYDDENSLNRTTIELDNWKSSPERWDKRFNNEALIQGIHDAQKLQWQEIGSLRSDRLLGTTAPEGYEINWVYDEE